MSQNDPAVQALNAAETAVVNAITTAVTAMNGAVTEINNEKTEIATQAATIASLQAQLAAGTPITEADLQPIIDALNGSAGNLSTTSAALEAAIPTPAPTSGT